MKCAKAIQVLAFGGPEVMKVHDVPIPSAGKGQVCNIGNIIELHRMLLKVSNY
jgi:hypothetical protein